MTRLRFGPARILVALTLALGCDGAVAPDAGPGIDAGVAPGADAATAPDAGAPGSDGGPRPDAATVDAGGAPDAGGDGCGRAPSGADSTLTLTHDGRERRLLVHVPSGYDPASPTPVVLDFHGRNSTPSQQIAISGMNGQADTSGFIAVHPEGVGQTWNAGVCCGEAMSEGVDDVGFTAAMIDRLAAELCVDRRRVYAIGLSNGAFMAHRLACQLSDRVAAIVAVAAPNGTSPCSPGRGVPVLHLHGTDDSVVPYDGFFGTLSVTESTSQWVARNGCGASGTETFASGDVRCEAWTGCRDGASVELCTVEGGGHQWPGGFTIPGLGSNTDAISATAYGWEFLRRYASP